MVKKTFRKCFVFGLITVIASYQGNVGVALASTVICEKETDLRVPDEVSLTKSSEKIVGESKGIALEKGAEAGEKLLQIDSDEQYVEAVSEVLEKYYQQSVITSQLDKFTDMVKPCAEGVVKDYREAYEERMESDSLSYDPEKVILQFRNDISDSSIQEAMEVISDGGELVSEAEIDSDLPAYKRDRIMKAKESRTNYKLAIADLSLAQSTDRAIEAYKKLDGVQSVERDQIMEFPSDDGMEAKSVIPNKKMLVKSAISDERMSARSAISNDPRVSEQWNLIQTNTAGAWNLLNSYTKPHYQIWAAVIDTGVDMNHEDLQGQLLENYSVDIAKEGHPLLTSVTPQYTSEHGTHVAGIIAAKANNSIGVAGVAGIPDSVNDTLMSCRVMAIKITQEDNSYTLSDLYDAIYYATDKGAEIINLSLGGVPNSSSLRSAIDYAYKAGVTVVAAAGNKNMTYPYYPSDFDHVISVISTDINRKKSPTSNYEKKDISAPGVDILSTIPGNKYDYMSGTSMATPFVAGVVALMKKADYSLKPDDMDAIIKDTAYDVGAPGYDPETAYGVVDPYHAVQRALSRYK
ncbi:MAG: S8 family serine peptidase [Lachnospiraceae bacterium]|nr:S8 family serine peptidase [Lachnospiraceae bacterium]